MQYRVLWSPHAEDQLELILERAEDAAVVAESARKLDGELVADPNSFGESRYDTARIGFVHPLAIQFEVMDHVRTVIVYDVWRIDRK